MSKLIDQYVLTIANEFKLLALSRTFDVYMNCPTPIPNLLESVEMGSRDVKLGLLD